MLEWAAKKAASLPSARRPLFLEGDIRTIKVERKFDAVVLMFAVLGYLEHETDVLAALSTAREHLRPGGVLAFDVWYGPAVRLQRPAKRTRLLDASCGRVKRTAVPGRWLPGSPTCEVQIEVKPIDSYSPLASFEETHRIRYFAAPELSHLLARTGFELLRLGGFPEFEHEPDESTWSVLAVARAAS